MENKDIHEQRLWERYSHYLNMHGSNNEMAIKQAMLDVQIFEEELKAQLES